MASVYEIDPEDGREIKLPSTTCFNPNELLGNSDGESNSIIGCHLRQQRLKEKETNKNTYDGCDEWTYETDPYASMGPFAHTPKMPRSSRREYREPSYRYEKREEREEYHEEYEEHEEYQEEDEEDFYDHRSQYRQLDYAPRHQRGRQAVLYEPRQRYQEANRQMNMAQGFEMMSSGFAVMEENFSRMFGDRRNGY